MGMTGEQAYVLAKKLIEAGGGGGGTIDAYTKTQTDNLLLKKVDKEVGKGLFSGSYNDLTDAPTIPSKTSELQNDSNFLTEHQDLTDYAKKTDLPTVPSKVSELENDSGYLTEHQDLTDYAKKTEIPSLDGYATEQWVGEQGYLTEHQDLSGYAKKTDFDVVAEQVDTNTTDINNNTTNIADIRKNTCTNLFKPTNQTATRNGVTCTNNGDGTYTLNGTYTASEGTTFEIFQTTDTKIFEKFLGCLFGFGKELYNKKVWLFIRFSGGTSNKEYTCSDIKPQFVIDTIPEGSTRCYVGLYISGTSTDYTFDNVTFKPMITTYLDATYDDFVSYTSDSMRINENVSDIKNTLHNAISDAWIITKTYSVGEYCIYYNKLWKCLVQNREQIPTEGTYWTNVSIVSELIAINNKLSTLSSN